jgi:hypothetical protein
VHDLRSGGTQPVAAQAGTRQSSARLSGGRLVWLDDRLGQGNDGWGPVRRNDVWSAELPYAGSFRQHTFAAPARSLRLIGVAAERVLTAVNEVVGIDAYTLLELGTDRKLSLEGKLVLGDELLALSDNYVLRRKHTLERCALERHEIVGQGAIELFIDGDCPYEVVMEDDFVAWRRNDDRRERVFWLDMRDLHAP